MLVLQRMTDTLDGYPRILEGLIGSLFSLIGFGEIRQVGGLPDDKILFLPATNDTAHPGCAHLFQPGRLHN